MKSILDLIDSPILKNMIDSAATGFKFQNGDIVMHSDKWMLFYKKNKIEIEKLEISDTNFLWHYKLAINVDALPESVREKFWLVEGKTKRMKEEPLFMNIKYTIDDDAEYKVEYEKGIENGQRGFFLTCTMFDGEGLTKDKMIDNAKGAIDSHQRLISEAEDEKIISFSEMRKSK